MTGAHYELIMTNGSFVKLEESLASHHRDLSLLFRSASGSTVKAILEGVHIFYLTSVVED